MAQTLYTAIGYFAFFLEMLILVRVLSSWLPIGRNNPFIRILISLTEPILGPIRRMIEKSPFGGPGMMLDFSPIIAGFAIELVRNLLYYLIRAFF